MPKGRLKTQTGRDNQRPVLTSAAHQPSKPAQFAIHQTESQKILNPTWFIRRPMVSWHTFPPFLREPKMSEENKIKVNDLPEDKKEQSEEVELPVVNNEEKRGGHSEGGCCGACGG